MVLALPRGFTVRVFIIKAGTGTAEKPKHLG